jgi:chitodextrinase
VELLNRGNADDLAHLAKLPGFVPAHDAATVKTEKRDVLAKMESTATDWWPVVNAQGKSSEPSKGHA